MARPASVSPSMSTPFHLAPLPLRLLPRMIPRRGLLAASLLAVSPAAAIPPPGFEPIEDGHVDFSFCYRDGVWTYGIIWERGGVPVIANPAVGPLRPPDNAVLLLKDQPFQPGNRLVRPEGAEWDFLGSAAHEPFWWIPQNSWNGLWQGFSFCGGCATFFEDDPRVNAEGNWRVVALKNKRYIGKGAGHYSTWSQGVFGEITVWMKTVDGIDPAQDRYWIGGDHAHPATGFSSLGLYEITIDVTCYDGPGETNPHTSPEVSFYFAVGTYWAWIARNFQPERWWAPGYIGELDDPDGDGISNLMEYACNLNPRVSDRQTFETWTGAGLQQWSAAGSVASFRFLQRRPESNPQITYTVRGTVDPAAAPWPLTHAPQSPPWDAEWLASDVTVPLAPEVRHFLRLEVELLPRLTYPPTPQP